MITINNLHKKFGEIQVLKGIDLCINTGVFAILGPNGSGKTTLNKCILGMVYPDKGTISIDNKEITSQWLYRQKIDYLPQIANFPNNITVDELIKMIKDLRNEKKIDETELLDLFKLKPFLKKKLNNLSGGTKQKVNLLLTFLFDSPILILDEPTTGLDPAALIILKDLILKEKQKGKIILVTSHIMSFVEDISDKIIFILEGKIYFNGSIQELKTSTGQESFEHAIANILIDNHA
ncbi:ABC transporter ATP-binding protein [Myroides marinus]|uniref:Copper ABC transporter ATP-binding protein n=1 Tax=Myroides marinus TaxID=703342 RepID=A0A163XTV6_9FLAO|nr:ABC transporter ATP-binding protein [Myroides marinus]KZE78431.1 copper ABC transporter ATP-binding protein [Myroides marinus]MDM1348185.1 ABC transporter ATP-binding protein [Myroides marinus]MDM1352499.1 ABC transporter ATP-binding protein [Myroides marinus]MDM1359701.1 ABC transporter ATP-binding protein [Myroides marinus]MDM1366806.1 ABC transporter ATP-binding protein [Myroides marinus]